MCKGNVVGVSRSVMRGMIAERSPPSTGVGGRRKPRRATTYLSSGGVSGPAQVCRPRSPEHESTQPIGAHPAQEEAIHHGGSMQACWAAAPRQHHPRGGLHVQSSLSGHWERQLRIATHLYTVNQRYTAKNRAKNGQYAAHLASYVVLGEADQAGAKAHPCHLAARPQAPPCSGKEFVLDPKWYQPGCSAKSGIATAARGAAAPDPTFAGKRRVVQGMR